MPMRVEGNAHEEWIGQAEGGGKAEKRGNQEHDFFQGEGMDAYKNHREYGYYEHRSCQLRTATGQLTESSTC